MLRLLDRLPHAVEPNLNSLGIQHDVRAVKSEGVLLRFSHYTMR